jgi:hypothetical protein
MLSGRAVSVPAAASALSTSRRERVSRVMDSSWLSTWTRCLWQRRADGRADGDALWAGAAARPGQFRNPCCQFREPTSTRIATTARDDLLRTAIQMFTTRAVSHCASATTRAPVLRSAHVRMAPAYGCLGSVSSALVAGHRAPVVAGHRRAGADRSARPFVRARRTGTKYRRPASPFRISQDTAPALASGGFLTSHPTFSRAR